MKLKSVFYITVLALAFGCTSSKKEAEQTSASHKIDSLFEKYYAERMKLFPLEATLNGENQYNNILPIDISDSYRAKLKEFYETTLSDLQVYDRNQLSANDQISYDVLKHEMEISLAGLKFNDNYQPIQQFWSTPLTMGQLGAGSGNQPFKTTTDYSNFLERINGFYAWCDTAIVYMRKGISYGEVMPKILMERSLVQFKNMIANDVKQSIFYGPIKNLPTDFSEDDKKRITAEYEKAIVEKINPSYQKLHDFMEREYIPSCRETAGLSALPNGSDRYSYLIQQYTTTTLTAQEIFDLGEKQVKEIRSEMEKIKEETGFTGDLKSFFNFINTDPKFFPFKTSEEILQAYRAVETKIEPQLKNFFGVIPKSKFEVRETEKFRAASASAEYNNAAPDGSRPGIFYVPIVDATKCNYFGMESLFLHEAIPGHHYQTSLQAENDSLPKFRRFIWYSAYGEGWALYTESLGKELGLYSDPYQRFGSLSKEMHRAIRLVTDAGIHYKGWTREQAIAYSMENEPGDEKSIATEIERYMAIPGQALSYKIGQLKIIELRKEAEKALGSRFNLSKFHDEVLSDGCLPISVLESKIKTWIKAQKNIAVLNDNYGIPAFHSTVQ
jgi:uncharacterized protein (DUF885 family)